MFVKQQNICKRSQTIFNSRKVRIKKVVACNEIQSGKGNHNKVGQLMSKIAPTESFCLTIT